MFGETGIGWCCCCILAWEMSSRLVGSYTWVGEGLADMEQDRMLLILSMVLWITVIFLLAVNNCFFGASRELKVSGIRKGFKKKILMLGLIKKKYV
jgi:hypothetical protein